MTKIIPGVLVVNIVCRVESVKEEAIQRIREKFALVAEYKLTEDVNHIILASCRKDISKSEWEEALKASAVTVTNASKNSTNKDDGLDLDDFFKNIIL